MNDEERSLPEMLGELRDRVHQVRALTDYRTPSHVLTNMGEILYLTEKVEKIIYQEYVPMKAVVEAGHKAAAKYIEYSNLEADALRYRKIVAHPDLDLEYLHEDVGQWCDTKGEATKGMTVDELHKLIDPIVDSYEFPRPKAD